MSDSLYDIDIPYTSYAVIYEDKPEEEKEEVVCVKAEKTWWCPCWA